MIFMPSTTPTVNLAWVLGIAATFSIFVVTTILGFQSGVDSRQDRQLSRLSENDRDTAEALRDVAATLREIDQRGTLVFRAHERLDAEEGH